MNPMHAPSDGPTSQAGPAAVMEKISRILLIVAIILIATGTLLLFTPILPDWVFLGRKPDGLSVLGWLLSSFVFGLIAAILGVLTKAVAKHLAEKAESS